MLRGPCNNITMIRKIKNFICSLFNIKQCACPEEDEHLTLYVTPSQHCEEHAKYKHRCLQCQEAIK